MDLTEFLRPTKSKIILALLIPYIYLAIVVTREYIISTMTNSPASSLVVPASLFLIAGSLLESVITYPFACSLVVLFNKARSKTLGDFKSDRKGMLMVSLSILILNPLSLNLILAALILTSFSLQAGLPCGVLVAGVYKDSPAEIAGLQENEIILAFDGENTRDHSRLLELLSRKKPGDMVKVITDKGEHELELGTNPDTGGPYIGGIFTDNYCDCGNGMCEPGEQVVINTTTFTYCARDCG